MKTNFIEDFKSSEYFKTFFDNPDIVMAFLAGSRATELENDASDFDIVVIYRSGAKNPNKGLYLKYDNKVAHFYYRPFNNFLGNYYTATGSLISLFQFAETTKLSVLYKNDKYKDLIEKLFEKQFSLANIAQLKFAKNYEDLINAAAQNRVLSSEHYSKMVYHLVYISNRLSHVKSPKQTMLAIKHCAQTGLSEEEEAYAVERLSNLKYFIDNYSMEDLVVKMEEETKELLKLEAELNGN